MVPFTPQRNGVARRLRGHSKAYDIVLGGVRLSFRSSYVPRANGKCDYERTAPHRALAPYLPRTTLWRSQLFAVSFQPELRLDQDDARVSRQAKAIDRAGHFNIAENNIHDRLAM
jgi:hypothetical protein